MISKEDLEEQLRMAVRSRDKTSVSVLRLLLSAIHNKEIDKRGQLEEEDVLRVIKKEVKDHQESIEACRQAGRKDLLDKEEAELAVLSKFVPQELSEEEIRQVVGEVVGSINSSGSVNFGVVMGQVMAKIGSRADGSLVAKVVREEFKN